MTHVTTSNADDAAPDSRTVGHRSPLSDDAAASVLRNIRAFQPQDSVIRVVSLASSSEDGSAAHDVYEDESGYVFRLDPRDSRVVQVDRYEDRHSKARPAPPDSRRPVADLRRLASAIAAAHAPSYAKDPASFHPMEGNRDRELYVFRWEDCRAPLPESDDPPYIEVGLYADGTLARFTDALMTRP